MGMSLDHCIHCALHVMCLNCYMLCDMRYVNYMHGEMYMTRKETLGLENITLGVEKQRNGMVQGVKCLLVGDIGSTRETRR